MEILPYIIVILSSLLFGLIWGINISYRKIIKDKKFSWEGKFYKIIQIKDYEQE